jgi:hypothetical protein
MAHLFSCKGPSSPEPLQTPHALTVPQTVSKASRRRTGPSGHKPLPGTFSTFHLSHNEVMRCLCLGGCIEYHLGVIL